MRNIYKYSFILGLVLLITSIFLLNFKLEDKTSTSKTPDEYIASYIEGEYQTEIPGKDDGYVVDKIVCDNGATATWNTDEWGIDIRNASKKVKCSIYFEKTTIADQITALATKDTTNFATDDPDNNIRYIGKDPNNYIYFNCSDYANQSDETCEKWRIIGLFNNITKEDGTKEDLVKIIREERLNDTNIIWDYKQTGAGTSTTANGSNDWTDSQLMMMLNPVDYLKSGYAIEGNIVKDSNGQAIYQNMGSYYNGTSGCKPSSIIKGSSFSCTSIDFTSTGLKNDLTRNAIESVTWDLGGTASFTSSSNGLASHWYSYERGTVVYSAHATKWIGKIGLMYPSDYGYATAGGTATDRINCLSKELYKWSNATDCYNNDYLYNSEYNKWTLTPFSSIASYVFYVTASGIIDGYHNASHGAQSLQPTLFLKSNTYITSGDGSSSSPYQLKLQ